MSKRGKGKPKGDYADSRAHEVPISILGYEAGSQRIIRVPGEDIETRLSGRSASINTWRENLTGLSQVHNLYFVAFKDKLHVYIPCHPEQTLRDNPKLIISIARSGANTSGYIDLGCPHSINHLLISFLGGQEILLACCDDGDVLAYYTSRFQDAIDDDDDDDSMPMSAESGASLTRIRPFFVSNVGKSAWGLAVHTHARKIAVSANTRNVTVYSFALTSSNPEIGAENVPKTITEADAFAPHPEKTVIGDAMPSVGTRDRAQDQRFTLGNHVHNLPTVAFCNTGDDLEGRWLACGDINGVIYTWDLHTLKTVDFTRAEFCRGQVSTDAEPRCMCDPLNHRFPHAIWGLHWLDSRAFRPVSMSDQLAAIRLSGDEMKRKHDKSQPQDISHQRIAISRNAQRFNILNRSTSGRNAPGRSHTVPAGNSDSPSESDSVESDQGDVSELYDPDNDSTTAVTTAQHTDVADFDDSDDDDMADAILWQADVLEGMDTEDEADLEPHAYRAPTPQFRRDIRIAPLPGEGGSTYIMPKSPFMSLSQHDIFLQQPRDIDNDPGPILGLHDPFKQTVPNFRMSQSIDPYNRISLSQSIPELGLVIVGTPKGRVAVLSLQQCDESPPPDKKKTDAIKTEKKKASFAQRSSKHQAPMYFLRLEWILPFKEQEEDGQRPLCPLVGIAAGPMKGMQESELTTASSLRPRRWRLMLTWCDHTVLSYEIGAARSSGIDGDSLLI